jgi:hypothetical protein
MVRSVGEGFFCSFAMAVPIGPSASCGSSRIHGDRQGSQTRTPHCRADVGRLGPTTVPVRPEPGCRPSWRSAWPPRIAARRPSCSETGSAGLQGPRGPSATGVHRPAPREAAGLSRRLFLPCPTERLRAVNYFCRPADQLSPRRGFPPADPGDEALIAGRRDRGRRRRGA